MIFKYFLTFVVVKQSHLLFLFSFPYSILFYSILFYSILFYSIFIQQLLLSTYNVPIGVWKRDHDAGLSVMRPYSIFQLKPTLIAQCLLHSSSFFNIQNCLNIICMLPKLSFRFQFSAPHYPVFKIIFEGNKANGIFQDMLAAMISLELN